MSFLQVQPNTFLQVRAYAFFTSFNLIPFYKFERMPFLQVQPNTFLQVRPYVHFTS